ncbi:MAG TPA: hypothetical protein VIR03_01065 [Candidatus Saccharimonadales bacterium]
MTQKINLRTGMLAVGIGLWLGSLAVIVQPQTALVAAAVPSDTTTHYCPKGQSGTIENPCTPNPNDLPSTPDPAAQTCTGGDCSKIITKYINPAIKILSGLVGVIVTVSIVAGGIQYASAGGDPSKVVAARKRITNSILALLAYLFLFMFLQWLIPGGIV